MCGAPLNEKNPYKERAFMKNIILIGMPGCGKSTSGVLLAKKLGLDFIDTDLIIQLKQKNTLQNLIDKDGLDKFREYENDALLAVTAESGAVIATGGSAIFCEEGMKYLKQHGVCVYLGLSLDTLSRRLTNLKTRGIACRSGETLEDIFNEREPFYNRYADITINCAQKSSEETVEQIIVELKQHNFA